MCVHAFQKATHVISLDACHIKARYGGVVLVLTVLDGNGNIFPASIAIAESENEETWSWFCSPCVLLFTWKMEEMVLLCSAIEKKGLKMR